MRVIRSKEELKSIPFPVKLVAIVGFLTTILVNPWTATDPVNLIKLGALTIGGFTLMIYLAKPQVILEKIKLNKVILILILIFITQLLLVVIFSGSNIALQFYGIFGRNTGFLAYLSLAILFAVCVFYIERQGLRLLLAAFFLVGLLSTIYGTVQSYYKDPINWSSWNPVIGFLGNTNFQASLLGMFGILLASIIVSNIKNFPLVVPIIILLFQVVRVILRTSSQQGVLVLLIGVLVVLLLRLRETRHSKLLALFSFLSLVAGILLILGALQFGFLQNYIYKDSISFRGDYWRAGLKMITSHPIFGVGLDSYGAWYRSSRDITATLRRGPQVITDNPHNVFIDFGASGGFVLLFAYIGITIFVLVSAIRFLKKSKDYDPFFATLLALWLGYQAQSLISINQLGLAVWGWIFGGAIVGYANSKQSNPPLNGKLDKPGKLTKTNLAGVLLGAVLGIIVIAPPTLADSSLHKAMASGLPEDFARASNAWPADEARLLKIGVVYFNNAYYVEAREIFLKTSREFPRSFDAWQMLANLPNATEFEKKKANLMVKSLDPFNSNLK